MRLNKKLTSVLDHIRAGKILVAKGLCTEVLREQPDNAQALYIMGVIYHKLGDHNAAIKNIEKSLQIQPNYLDACYSLGNIYQDTQQHDMAIACYEKVLQLNPHSAVTYYNVGFSMQCKGQIDEAIAYYQKALSLNFQTFSLYNNLGVAFQAKGQFDEAITCYHNAVKLNATSPEVFNNLGIVYQIKGHLDEAICYYQKALELKRDYADAYCNLGTVLREKGQFDDAIPYFQKTIELNQSYSWAYMNMGVILDNKGKLNEAKVYFQKAFHYIPMRDQYAHVTQLFKNIDCDKIPTDVHNMSTLILVCAYNRQKITRLSLAQINRYKTSSCHLQVYNDHSTEYDNSFLAEYADEVIQLPNKMGINELRWYQLEKFLETDFDFIYMTDNDVIHDPQFIFMLKRLYEIGERKLPVTLYNNIYTMRPHMIIAYREGLIIKTTAPGTSMLFDKAMVRKILDTSNKMGKALDFLPWDNRAAVCLGLPWLSTEVSYLEHYGAQGINNDNYDRDRAIFPTQYLRDRRVFILKHLLTDAEIEIIF